ncbi:MAG: glycosyltransferase [Deltaproteobacteria bacterium]|nr:glycosyltransferase [Deltaproteobacteria bacterium]
MRILILTHGAPPLPGKVAVGNALRAWSLGLALEAAGHGVRVMTRVEDVAGVDLHAADLPVITFGEPEELRAVVSSGAADALVVCQWDILGQLPDDLKIPVVADLYAPRMLEAQFQGLNLDAEFVSRIETLSRADFFLCTTQRQRWFYLPWLMMAGVDCRRPPVGVVPLFPLATPEPKGRPPGEPVLVSGGVFWPWQEASPRLLAAAAAIEALGKGRLALYGGAYPLGTDGMKYAAPPDELRSHARVEFKGMLPYDDLMAQYRSATAALNVAEPNSERELSFSFRDIDYLAAGLPIIIGSYCEMARLVEKYDAGWVVDPADTGSLARAIESAFDEPEVVARKSGAATELARKEFNPADSVKPLSDFLASPATRTKRTTLLSAIVHTADGFFRSAERCARDQQQIRELQEKNSDLRLQVVSATEARDESRRRLSDVETKLTSAETKESWAREETARLKSKIVELERAVADRAAIEDRLLRSSDEKNSLHREAGWLRDELKRSESAAKIASDEAARLRHELGRMQEVEAANAAIPGLRAEIEAARGEAARLALETERRQVEIERLRAAVDERDRRLREVQDACENASREKAWTADELKRHEIAAKALCDERDAARRDLAFAQDELKRGEARRRDLEEKARLLDAEVRRRDAEIGTLRPMADELNGLKSLPLYKAYKKILG